MRSNFQKPTSKNLQCAVLQSWMLLICRKLHWLLTAGSCCSLCDAGFVWQLQSFLFQRFKKGSCISDLPEMFIIAATAKRQRREKWERVPTVQQLANMYISQEIGRGHLCFITMCFHMLNAASSLSLIAAVLYPGNQLVYAPQPCQMTLQRKKHSQSERKRQHQQIQSCLKYNDTWLMQD